MYDEVASDDNYDSGTASDEYWLPSEGLHIDDVDKLDEIESSSSTTLESIDPVDELLEETSEVDSCSSDG